MKKELLMSILISKDNDFFRNTFNKTDENYIFDAQINTARKIVMQLASNSLRTNHVMLLAPMQSGKTATCLSVVNIIEKSELYKNMHVNKYLFITGLNDCGLKEQTYKRIKSQVINADENNVYAKKSDNINDCRFFVLKNSDLLSFPHELDNSIIFIDESHYGSNEKNVLTKFLIKHGIDWKNSFELIKRNIYIISISATPFDELVSDRINAKKTIVLTTDSNYIGVTEYFNNDVIFDAEKGDIEEDGAIFDYIMDAKWRMQNNNENGAIIIRTRNFSVIQNNQYVKNNFDIVEMYANGSKIEYDKVNQILNELYLSNKNKINIKPIIFLIKGAFRAGITIEKKYKDIIYMIYDYSEKADSTAQALLGRMCGYRDANDKINNTYFYINKKYANMYNEWSKDFQNKNLIPCNNMDWSWVDNGYSGEDVIFGSKSCGNFAIPLNDEEIKEIYFLGKGKRKRAKLIENLIKDIFIKNNIHIKYDYINEVQISGKNNYSKNSQIKRFENFNEESLVFQFRPDKIKEFIYDTNRNFLTRDDLGKKCISIVLDAEIYEKNKFTISGNKRLLIYYVEVGQKKQFFCRKNQYKPHKDTEIYE